MQIESVHFYLKLVASPKLLQHRDQHQKKIVNEMIATVAQWSAMPIPPEFNPITKETVKFHLDGKPILEFSLPRIVAYQINLPQDRVFNKNHRDLGDFVLWKTLLRKEFQGFLEGFKKFDGENTSNLHKGLYCGETVEISVSCLNVMNFTTVCENLCVFVEHEDGETTQTESLETLELGPNEEKRLLFSYKHLKPGKIQIQSLRWSFGKVFYGNFRFKPESFQVSPAVSGVQIEFLHCPDFLLEGEVQELKFKFKNESLNAIEDLSLSFSHPYLFGRSTISVGSLSESEEKEVKLRIRGEKIGFHLLRFLATYSSLDQKRFARFQHSLEVRPSLRVTTRLDYSVKDIHESILHLVVRPAIESRLELKQVTPLTGHSLRLIKDIANEVYYFGVSPGDGHPVNFSSSNLDEDRTFINEVKSVLRSDTSIGLDLLIHWELETDRLVSGYHFLLDLTTRELAYPIRVTLKSASDIRHDFNKSTLCQVPVTFCVKNVSGNSFDSLSLTAVQDEDFKDFTWVGSTSEKSSMVSTGQTVTLHLLASFSRPGCYDLNRFVVRINDSITDIPRPLQQILIS
jgi:hypothetical protein